MLKKIKLSESTISTLLGAAVIVIIGVLIVNYFRGINKPQKESVVKEETGGVQLVEEEGKLVPEGLPITYKVEENNSLWEIAERFYGSGYNWVDIAEENKLTNPDALLVGQELQIPKTTVIQPQVAETINEENYTVAKGDHLWEIAVRAYGDGYQWVKIAQANNLSDPSLIHPGNVLKLPR